RHRMLKSEVYLSCLLDLYIKTCSERRRVRDDETNLLACTLRLSGIVRVREDRLRVRNRIYAHVFSRAWAYANIPDAERRRQRIAYRAGLLRSAVAGMVAVSVVAF